MAASLSMAQDVVWCELCLTCQFIKSSAELHCKTCNINLCQGCAGKHLVSKISTKHEVVEYKLKEAEPNYPECQIHLRRKCELHCRQCGVPVCVICLADSHKKHDVEEILSFTNSKLAQIIQDTEELENVIAPEYEQQDSRIEVEISEKSEKYDALIACIAMHGQNWHKEIDNIITNYSISIQMNKSKDIDHLKKRQSEIKNTKSLIFQLITKNKKILSSNDVTEVGNYRSRNEKFKEIPPMTDFSIPKFQPIQIQGKELLRQFGTLSASIKTEVEGYTIQIPDHIADDHSKHLDKSEVITTINSGTSPLYSISCAESDQAWISGHDDKIKHVDIRGKLLQRMSEVCRGFSWPRSLSVSIDGQVLYCDRFDGSVKAIKDKNAHAVITLQDWEPCAVCCTSIGEILVLMMNGDKVKLVRFSGSEMKQEIEYDHKGKRLFFSSSMLSLRYIAENKNRDICVENRVHVVVVNHSGHLRFVYDAKYPTNKYRTFTPHGIATDSKCQILIADNENNCVHVIDKDGQFLCHIDKCNLVNPYPICVDSHGRLWVGLLSGKVKIIKYMHINSQ